VARCKARFSAALRLCIPESAIFARILSISACSLCVFLTRFASLRARRAAASGSGRWLKLGSGGRNDRSLYALSRCFSV
jgi:hypothetical protein